MRMIQLVALTCSALAAGQAVADNCGGPPTLMEGFPPSAETTVTAENWLVPPLNIWAFQHLEQVVPTRTVYRGTGPASRLPTASRQVIQQFERAVRESRIELAAFLAASHIDGLLIMKDGAVVTEMYCNGQTRSTRHIMMSVGKSVVGTLAALLVQEGTLDEDRPVASYVPELAGSAYGDATVRQVMDMTVAVDYNENLDDPESDVYQFLYAAGLGRAPPGIQAANDLYAFVRTLRKGGEHGRQFQYVTPTSEVLGWIIARATGESWADLFEKRILQPLGVERDGFVLVDAVGTQTAAGGLAMTLRDVGRFAQMIANDGVFDGRQILPKPVVRRIKQGGDPAQWPTGAWGWTGRYAYGSQWYVEHDSSVLSAFGIYGQTIQIGLKNNVVVVTQASWPVPGGPEYWERRTSFYSSVARALQ